MRSSVGHRASAVQLPHHVILAARPLVFPICASSTSAPRSPPTVRGPGACQESCCGQSTCWHWPIHRSAERSSPLAIAPSALKRHPASCGVGSRLAAAMRSRAAKKASLFRALNRVAADMVPTGSRNAIRVVSVCQRQRHNRPAGSDSYELATLEKVALPRLAGHAQQAENRIRPLVDQLKLALAAALAGRSVVMGRQLGRYRMEFSQNVHCCCPRPIGSPLSIS
jgi:hypothetical protein